MLALVFPAASAPAARAGLERIDPPAVDGAMAPNLLATDSGILLSWLEPLRPGASPGAGEWALRFARFEAGRWSAPREIVRSDRFFVNWADFPSMVAAAGGLYAHWAETSGPGTYSYDVQLARSTDGGASWKRIGKAHDDRTETEHGFVSFLPEGKGVRAFWLDGRRMRGEQGEMAVYTALVEERAGAGVALDGRVCECCQTSAAATARGPVLVYRDRSPGEIRDIAIVRRVAGRWSAPARVHADGWKIAGCPVNGPSVAARGDRLAVAWFTGVEDRPTVRAAFSSNAGASFGPAFEVDGEAPLGRVQILLSDRDALVLWVAPAGKEAEIRVRRVAPDGGMGEARTIARTSAARSSGFPRMAQVGEQLLVAWVEAGGKSSRLAGARLDLQAIPRAEDRGRKMALTRCAPLSRGREGRKPAVPDFLSSPSR
ncbi:MAG: exo-alpha-sialidase [Thermoanaerobaculia bacterium]